MMFFKLVFYDIKNGFIHEYKKIILIPVFFFILCCNFYFSYLNFADTSSIGSIGDFLLYIYGGMKEYIPSRTQPFQFPTIWMFVLAYLLYFTLYYPYDDLMGYGQHILIRSGGRLKWWYSKCIWNIVSVVFYFILSWCSVILFCVLSKMPLSFEISNFMYDSVFYVNENIALYPANIIKDLLLMPLLTMITISLLQMVLSLMVKPIYGFWASMACLLASAYYANPLMIANYAMAIRSDAVITNGINTELGIIIMIKLIISSVIIGGVIFNRYDILNKEV